MPYTINTIIEQKKELGKPGGRPQMGNRVIANIHIWFNRKHGKDIDRARLLWYLIPWNPKDIKRYLLVLPTGRQSGTRHFRARKGGRKSGKTLEIQSVINPMLQTVGHHY